MDTLNQPARLRYVSVCSGMEAASVAWHPLGWTPVGFSEIEPFPCAILKHRFPNTPNYGSLTEYQSWPIEQGTTDLLVGGTPCQSFSVAGLRKGMADPRGNLALTFLGLADRLKPRWIVWENVPGVLSSNGGRDFGAFLGALVQLGYGFAYRVLDAQHFGVPQRRRRVFVVAHLGDWKPAAEVLFESDCLRRDPPKGRKKGQGSAAGSEGGVGADGTVGTLCARDYKGADNIYVEEGKAILHPCPDHDTVGMLCARDFKGVGNQFVQEGKCIPCEAIPFRKSKRAQSETDDESWVADGKANTLNNFDLGDTRTTHAVVEPIQHCADVAPTVTSSGPPYSRTGNERVEAEALVAQPIAFQPGNLRRQGGADPSTENFPTPTKDSGDQSPHVAYPQGVDLYNQTLTGDLHVPLRTAGGHGAPAAMIPPMAVRRLTPVECERLQGFPDNWSRIPWKGKPEDQCPDGPRYKACGNSMAVPVMRWIGQRIAEVDACIKA